VSVFYLDASAWVKRYLKEPGSDRLTELFAGPARLVSTALGHVEVAATLSRQQVTRKLDENKLQLLQEQLGKDWNEITELPMTSGLFQQAIQLTQKYRLRGADAIHLAAALEFRKVFVGIEENLTLVASDHELLEAAANAGLHVEDPTDLSA
jgi:predicted nucleic acid-binding protein